MKILLLEGDMSRSGGTERMTAWLANTLCQNHSVTVLSLNMTKPEIFYSLDGNVSHDAVGEGNVLSKIRKIKKLIRSHGFDVLINVDTGMGYIGILSAKHTRCKTVTWEHSNFHNNWNSKIFPYIRKYAAKHSDAFVTLTERDKKNYESNIKCVPITVIPNPSDKHDFVYDINSKTILSAGLFNKIKRFDLIIPTAEKVFEKHPDWNWVICGDGPELAAVKKLAKNSSVEKNIIFPGAVKDMSGYYKKAAMYVMTSEAEGLPMVLLEAKSYGLPIVSFDINTGPSDIVRDGENGYLTESGNTELLAQKIIALAGDDELRSRFSKNSQSDMEKFSTEAITESWEKLLTEIKK